MFDTKYMKKQSEPKKKKKVGKYAGGGFVGEFTEGLQNTYNSEGGGGGGGKKKKKGGIVDIAGGESEDDE